MWKMKKVQYYRYCRYILCKHNYTVCLYTEHIEQLRFFKVAKHLKINHYFTEKVT